MRIAMALVPISALIACTDPDPSTEASDITGRIRAERGLSIPVGADAFVEVSTIAEGTLVRQITLAAIRLGDEFEFSLPFDPELGELRSLGAWIDTNANGLLDVTTDFVSPDAVWARAGEHVELVVASLDVDL
jgi:hypothetical protein